MKTTIRDALRRARASAERCAAEDGCDMPPEKAWANAEAFARMLPADVPDPEVSVSAEDEAVLFCWHSHRGFVEVWCRGWITDWCAAVGPEALSGAISWTEGVLPHALENVLRRLFD